jgi:hypothetical protein
MDLKLERRGYFDEEGTFGELSGGDFSCKTVELPWRNNQRGKSCIPEGTYIMRKRVSGVVQRTSGGQFTEGWEITNVPDRTYIMVHVGNTIADLDGCVAVGKAWGYIERHWGVIASRNTFRAFMQALEDDDEHRIEIYQYIAMG